MSNPSSWPVRFFGLFGPLNDLYNLVWAVRLCPVLSAVTFVLSETVFTSKVSRDVTLGMALNFSILLSVYTFRAKNLTLSSGSIDALFNPIWIPRIFPLIAAACMGFSRYAQHDFFGGIAMGVTGGIFITLFTTGFQTTEVTPRNFPAHDEPLQLHLNG